MKKRKVDSNKGWDNLRPRYAPDEPGETTPITVRITSAQREWLKNHPDGMGFHIRQALQAYIDSFE